MKLVIFGLTVSSSWGNGHATLWRALCRALAERGHEVVFFERDVPYYAEQRDLHALPGGKLVLYPSWASAAADARREIAGADAAMVTSYCPDALAAADLLGEARVPLRVFYDLDTPVTLERLDAGDEVAYVGTRGLRDYDLVLSYTGGLALDRLRTRLGARRVAPLYGSVDPAVHRPVALDPAYASDLSYLGTYAADRQGALERLFLEPARRLPQRRFVLGGAQYPSDFPWTPNVFFVRHLPPAQHPVFFCSSRLTLSVTRRAMAELGYCPSGRLFEAAACGVPLLTDAWTGLEAFFEPGRDVLVARDTHEALEALDTDPRQLAAMAGAARNRVLAEHTAERRAQDLEELLEAGLRTARGSRGLPASGAGPSRERCGRREEIAWSKR